MGIQPVANELSLLFAVQQFAWQYVWLPAETKLVPRFSKVPMARAKWNIEQLRRSTCRQPRSRSARLRYPYQHPGRGPFHVAAGETAVVKGIWNELSTFMALAGGIPLLASDRTRDTPVD